MKECCRRGARIVGISVVVALGAFAAQGAVAQSAKAGGAAPVKPHAPAHPVSKRSPSPSDAGSPAPSASTLGLASSGPSGSNDAGVVEARILDGGTRVFRFSELDIEGRLKSPQLVYFLRRVRAEFSAGDLGHRSFLREMSETRKESTF